MKETRNRSDPTELEVGKGALRDLPLLALAGALTALAYPLLLRFHHGDPGTDFRVHAELARAAAESGAYPPHFLYPLALNLLVREGGVEGLARASLVLVLLALLLKALVTIPLARALAGGDGGRLSRLELGYLVAAMFFVAPLPPFWKNPVLELEPFSIYLGQLSATIWHNPTAILALPFSLLAFLLLVRPGAGIRRDVGAGLALAVSVLLKPNFALAYLPLLALLAIARRLSPRRFALHAGPALACLALELFLMQRAEAGLFLQRGAAGIELAPLSVWRYLSPHPFGSFLVSLAFPAALAALLTVRGRRHTALPLPWLLLALALGGFVLLAETGARFYHANFYWGIVPALYIVFLASAVELLGQKRSGSLPKPASIVLHALLLAHIASGVWLYVRAYATAADVRRWM